MGTVKHFSNIEIVKMDWCVRVYAEDNRHVCGVLGLRHGNDTKDSGSFGARAVKMKYENSENHPMDRVGNQPKVKKKIMRTMLMCIECVCGLWSCMRIYA